MLTASLVVTGLTPATPAHAIANGSLVASGQYQFSTRLTMTAITRSDGTKYNSACSAGLVSASWLITAGHCFHDGNRNRVSGPPRYDTTATIGVTEYPADAEHTRRVVDVRQSPVEDVALARLDRPMIGVTPLALSTAVPRVDSSLRMTGWGATSSSGGPSTRLRSGLFKVKTVATYTVGVTSDPSKAKTSACPYDSGAPYFVPNTDPAALVSVENYGPSCPHSQIETTARIDTIAGWIGQTITP